MNKKKLTINCFLHKRYHYIQFFVDEIIKLNGTNKEKIIINLLPASDNEFVRELSKKLIDNNIDCKYIPLSNHEHGLDYPAKVEFAINNSYTEYYSKLDEDVFIPISVWEFMLDNLTILDNSENLLISPCLTTAIPSVDLFIEDFLDNENKKNLYEIFLGTTFHRDVTQCEEHEKLNSFTIGSDNWNYEDFYNHVRGLNTWMKGIHPIRVSSVAQNFINNYIIENFDRFYSKKDYTLSTVDRPYFTNNFFIIKTELFKSIINDESLKRDAFDEAPLNLYMINNKMKLIFIKNGFGVHPSFNWVGDYSNISDSFFNFIRTKN